MFRPRVPWSSSAVRSRLPSLSGQVRSGSSTGPPLHHRRGLATFGSPFRSFPRCLRRSKRRRNAGSHRVCDGPRKPGRQYGLDFVRQWRWHLRRAARHFSKRPSLSCFDSSKRQPFAKFCLSRLFTTSGAKGRFDLALQGQNLKSRQDRSRFLCLRGKAVLNTRHFIRFRSGN